MPTSWRGIPDLASLLTLIALGFNISDALAGNDTVLGDASTDTLFGSVGDDSLAGGAAGDTL